MSGESFLDGKVILHPGDCLEVLKTLAANSVDSVVTDPPYHLTNNSGTRSPYPGQYTPIGKPKAPKGGFMGKQWDGGDIAFRVELWAAVLRVLKPGGHVVAFSGTRTYHRMACAIEDAGFEIRDQLAWAYGSGFPKSHDVSKAIDRHLGGEREQVRDTNPPIPATAAAAAWDGWGTALKPAWEPICFGRKPLLGTVAENVLKHGTGAINIDACRVGSDTRSRSTGQQISENTSMAGGNYSREIVGTVEGRWPANVIHDGSDEVVGAFPDVHGAGSARSGSANPQRTGYEASAYHISHDTGEMHRFGDSGSAARFFYTAKADSDDRLGSKHPTVKPLDLIQWLVRLVTPPGGTILDPFAGTGTTGEAAWREGFNAVLIEREVEYQSDIRRRMALCMSGPEERKRESIKARMKDKPDDHGPLFAGSDTPPRRGRQIYGVFADEPSGRRD